MNANVQGENIPLEGDTRNRTVPGHTGWLKPSLSASIQAAAEHYVSLLINGQSVFQMNATYIVRSFVEGNTLPSDHGLHQGYHVLTMQHKSPASGHGEPREYL